MNKEYLEQLRKSPAEAINYSIRASIQSAFDHFLNYYFRHEDPRDIERLTMTEVDVTDVSWGVSSSISFKCGVMPKNNPDDFLDFWIKIGIDSVDDCSKLTWGKHGRKGVFLCINMWEDDCDIVPWPRDYYFDSLHDIMVISDVYYSGRHDEAVDLA